jgi:hypothetical protein
MRLFQRAAEDDKTTLVDGTMNANLATKPGMMTIKNLAKSGPVGVLKPRCTTKNARMGRSGTDPRLRCRIAMAIPARQHDKAGKL